MDREAVRALAVTLGLVIALAGAIAAIVLAIGLGGSDPVDLEIEEISREARSDSTLASGDPLAWTPQNSKELADRATLGTSHVIYEKSPGGVIASVQRTLRWRDEIAAAAKAEGVDPDTLEAIVFLESAGRSQVMADGTPNSASGLAQIIPSTATSFLGMQVDLPRSIELTNQINKALRKGKESLAARLIEERRAIDERFDPQKALNGMARYIATATDRFGTEELAIASYHMGIGNLENVIEAYVGDDGKAGSTAATVAENEIDYARLYFDSSPQANAAAYDLLAGFGDDSSLYSWRIRASREILADWRRDPAALEAQVDLATEKATLEETYHPESETDVFETPEDIADATDDGKLARVPSDRSFGFKLAGQAGELADELDQEPELYRVLRPEALAALIYLAGKVEAVSGASEPLTVTSLSRDQEYQDLLVGINSEATSEYSLHTTGWSFDIRRKYANDKQARAFQFALDRLRAHSILDYAYEPAAIHVTVSENADVLLDD
ncbi:MAG TPA: transglycosylase SLT domain-containing protein [Solirubrobacterales bacterium]|nr:transglycosylase SLT domain-containing protein [Solirubrobacterales bacterium]